MPEIVHISGTPNPLAKKFHCDEMISPAKPLSFSSSLEASASETAKALFDLDYVTNVFMLDQVVTINVRESTDWEMVEPELSMLLEEYLEASTGSVPEQQEQPEIQITFPEDFFGLSLEDQLSHLNRILEAKVRPGLAGDGGGLDIMGIEGNTVYIYYLGACGSCPSATTGTLNYIQTTFKQLAHPTLEVALS